MKSFSQRNGITPICEIIQINQMNDALRNSIWNAFDIAIWSTKDFIRCDYAPPGIDAFTKELWFSYFKKPIDSRPRWGNEKLQEIRNYFFECPWNEVYDFVEFVLNSESHRLPRL